MIVGYLYVNLVGLGVSLLILGSFHIRKFTGDTNILKSWIKF